LLPSDSDKEHAEDWLNEHRIGDPIISPAQRKWASAIGCYYQLQQMEADAKGTDHTKCQEIA
jgi:hypothetical protein